MLLETLAAGILGNALTGKGVIREGQNWMKPHSEIQKYYQSEPKLNEVYSKKKLSKIKDGIYIINVHEYELIGTSIVSECRKRNILWQFGVENFSNEIRKFIRNKNIITNIYRVQAYDSMMCRNVCIGFIDFILQCKSLL